MYYFGQFKDHKSEAKKETREIIPFFHLTVRSIHFCIWKLSKFIFIALLLWFILVCKIPEFWSWNLWDQNFVPFDSANIHIKESKKPSFTCSIKLRTKFVWSHVLLTFQQQSIIMICFASGSWINAHPTFWITSLLPPFNAPTAIPSIISHTQVFSFSAKMLNAYIYYVFRYVLPQCLLSRV